MSKFEHSEIMRIFIKNFIHSVILTLSVLPRFADAQNETWCKSLGWETYVKTELEQQHLKGPVSSVLTKRFYANEKYGEIIMGRSAAKNLRDSKSYFDSLGCLSKKIAYDTAGVIDIVESFSYNQQHRLLIHSTKYSNKTLIENKFTYNGVGDKITESYFRQGTETVRYIFEYNEKGQIAKESKYGRNGDLEERTVYKCSESLKTKVGILKDKNGKVWQESKYTYDSNGNLIEELVTNSEYTQKTIYKYDNLGRQIYSEVNNPTWYFSCEAEYNNNNDVIKELQYSRSGNLIGTISYVYTYDNYNNWIKCIQYDDDIARLITTRKIEYFH